MKYKNRFQMSSLTSVSIQRFLLGFQNYSLSLRFREKINNTVNKKVKQSRNRPGVAQRVPGGLDSQIFMTFGT